MRTAPISACIAACLFSTAVLAAPCDGFVDVDSSANYCTAVTYVQQRGVTVGCTDSTHYCPNDYVTRAQMALYLQRMGQADPSNTLGDHTTAIGGGTHNTVTGEEMNTIAGGNNNTASGGASTVGGGVFNSATNGESTVVGGGFNTASGGSSTVVGGYQNAANGTDSIVVGGTNNQAYGYNSLAAGNYANADFANCAVFSFWNQSSTVGMSCMDEAGSVRFAADHGLSIDYGVEQSNGGGNRYVYFGNFAPGVTIGVWNGATLTDGGAWTNASDRNLKTDFVPANAEAVLDKVAAMPMDTWRYKSESGERHLGPMAQDFYAAFGLGADDKHITTVDEGGVALAAIQGLNAKVEQQALTIGAQQNRIADLSARVSRAEALAVEVDALKVALAVLQRGRETVAAK